MSRSTSITLPWADGVYTFCLNVEDIRELQRKCDAGPAFILGRLADGSYLIDDIYQTIRLGLIGGGLDPIKSLALTDRYVLKRPWLENIQLAQAIISAALAGFEDEPLGKPEEENEAANLNLFQEESSVLPPSMDQPPSSESAPVM
jgi:hypothetical protein